MKIMGLERVYRKKYRAGEEQGIEAVLYGPPESIFFVRKFPITSRFINDIANAYERWKKGEKVDSAMGYLLGISAREMDTDARKRFLKIKIRDRIHKATLSRGASEFKKVYVPESQRQKVRTFPRHVPQPRIRISRAEKQYKRIKTDYEQQWME